MVCIAQIFANIYIYIWIEVFLGHNYTLIHYYIDCGLENK